MRRQKWLRGSLARKLSLLFGTAVLMTIAAALAFPWQQMTALNEQAMLLRARLVATAVVHAVDLYAPDWSDAQRQLDAQWSTLSEQVDVSLDPPRLVRVDRHGQGFQLDAIERLQRFPEQRYYWQIQQNGDIFRFARAVRATDLDPHPHQLLGIIDVRLPIARDQGVWNSVVTVLAGASGAVLAILVFYLVTQRWVLSPVRLLRRVAEKVTSGDIEVRSSIRTGDEFQKLSDAFNDMLARLNAAREEQEKINRSLDIRLGELAETNVALYESARLKSEFLANVTHELRTPLVSIIGFAELLKDATGDDSVDPKRLSRFSQNILISGRSLLELINDLLDLAKIEAGKIELHVTDFSIEQLCGDLVAFVEPLAEKRGQKLTSQVEPNLPLFHSDTGRLKQILYNLMSNAVKFTPPGGEIAVRVTAESTEHVRISVEDNGPGIAVEDRETIFEKFKQLDASATREYTGSGLGLAITKDLVHLLGGRVGLESEVGRGSTFYVVLPYRVQEDPSPTKIPVERTAGW